MDKSIHYGKCVILGCNRPATVRNFACLHGPWMLKPDQIEQFKSGITLKICAGHYNEDLRLYPRDKTPKSDHPPYPVTEEEIKDYWSKVSTFSSSTVSAPIRATAPKPVRPKSSSDNLKRHKVHRGPGRPSKLHHPVVRCADVLDYNHAPAVSPMYDWESGVSALSSATDKELFELDHSPASHTYHDILESPAPAFGAKVHSALRSISSFQEMDGDSTPDEEEHYNSSSTTTSPDLGKRKRPHLSLELSKLHSKRRRVHSEKERNISSVDVCEARGLPDKFVPNITLTFNLSNDPCMKYSLGIVADKDYECASYTSFRLRSEVIYVETDKERFELSWSGSRPATLPTTPVGASTTRKDVILDTYRWVRVLNPRRLDFAALAELDVPLPERFVEPVEDDLDWSEIEWGQNTIRIRGNEYHLRSIQFFKMRANSIPLFDDYDNYHFADDEQEEEGRNVEEGDFFRTLDATHSSAVSAVQLQSAA